jgi:predicted lipid-binding transport protein (Tim44 family)
MQEQVQQQRQKQRQKQILSRCGMTKKTFTARTTAKATARKTAKTTAGAKVFADAGYAWRCWLGLLAGGLVFGVA